jgi:spore coat protein U-like protein
MKKNIVLSFLALLPLFALASRADGALICTFGSVTGVNFGSYDVFSASATTATGSISYSCTGTGGSKTSTISLSTGSGTFANRTLRSGGNVLNYNLYPTAAYSQPWGDGTGVTYQYGPFDPANKSSVTLPVYGKIPPLQDVGVGNYTDTITVTFQF